MRQTVHMLATVRRRALIEAALLVFRTVRVGFPSADIVVRGNELDVPSAAAVAQAAAGVGAQFGNGGGTSHDAWIEDLVRYSSGPFWLCDTDMVFWESVEGWRWGPDTAIAGRFEPEFAEEWTRSVHVERLHTCLMWVNAPVLRTQMRALGARVPDPFRQTASWPWIRQTFIPRGKTLLFYDTCAGLWQGGIGTPFTEEQNAAFEHLHCATYADAISPHLHGVTDLAAGHRMIYADHNLARGMRQHQDQYYAARAVKE